MWAGSWSSRPLPWKLPASVTLSCRVTGSTPCRSSCGPPDGSVWDSSRTTLCCRPMPPSWTRYGSKHAQLGVDSDCGVPNVRPSTGQCHARPRWGNRRGCSHVWRQHRLFSGDLEWVLAWFMPDQSYHLVHKYRNSIQISFELLS